MTASPLFENFQYIDGFGNTSVMAWVPPFQVAYALTEPAALYTVSGTVGDWFFVDTQLTRLQPTVDYVSMEMGGFYVDRFLCSAADASDVSRGSVDKLLPFISQSGVAPMVDQTISVFKEKLRQRFEAGGFVHGPHGKDGYGGLLPDAYWNQIWIYARLSGCPFHGNTDNGTCFLNPNETGQLDPTTIAGTLTGAGPKSWQEPLSDFTGNRAEFTDGLRLLNGMIYTAGLTIDPPASAFADSYKNTGFLIEGVRPYYSVASYRSEALLSIHSIGASDCSAGEGGMCGQAMFYTTEGERIADRGSGWTLRELAPGKLSLGKGPEGFGDRVGGRAIWVPK